MEKVIVRGYEVALEYDSEDQIYVARALALPGCTAHGPTQEEAAREVATAIELYLSTARDLGRPVPATIQVYGDAIAL